MYESSEPLYKPQIPPEWLARGTGETVLVAEITALDCMPQIIGSRFMYIGELKGRIHNNADEGYGAYAVRADAYKALAVDELETGNLTEALDAYRLSLHYSMELVRSVSAMQDIALLNEGEVHRLDFLHAYSELEAELTAHITAQEVAHNPATYAEFVKEVRNKEKRYEELRQLYSDSIGRTPETRGRTDNPEITQEYLIASLEKGKLSEVGGAYAALGLTQLMKYYFDLKRNTPKFGPNPRAEEFVEAALARSGYYDR